jgi:hypothetical protein
MEKILKKENNVDINYSLMVETIDMFVKDKTNEIPLMQSWVPRLTS